MKAGKLGYGLLAAVVLLVGVYVGAKLYFDAMAERELLKATAEVEDSARIVFSGVSADLLRQGVEINGVIIDFRDGTTARAKSVFLEDIDLERETPHFLSAMVRGIEIDVDEGNFGSDYVYIQRLGYQTFFCDLDLSYVYDQELKRLRVEHVDLNVRDVGRISADFSVGNVNIDELSLERQIGLQIVDVKVDYNDASLADRMLKTLAQDAGISEEEAVKRISARIDANIEWAEKENNSIAAEAFRGLKSFLKKREGIRLTSSPEEPVPWLYFFMGRNMLEIISLLNIEVESDLDQSK